MSDVNTTSGIRIMLVDDKPERAVWLNEVLQEQGLLMVGVLPSTSGLLHQIEQKQPDLILVDLESPGRDVLESLSVVNTHLPKPVVMFSGENDSGFIEEAVSCGVTAYMSSALDAATVKPILILAMAQFRSFHELRSELDKARGELSKNTFVTKAVNIICKHKKVSQSEAHKALRQMSMASNQKLDDAARQVIDAWGGRDE